MELLASQGLLHGGRYRGSIKLFIKFRLKSDRSDGNLRGASHVCDNLLDIYRSEKWCFEQELCGAQRSAHFVPNVGFV